MAQQFNLEERTLKFSMQCLDLCSPLSKTIANNQLISQLLRSAGSVGANYREANDSITRRDFFHRIGICRREAKESKYWLQLLLHANQGVSNEILPLIEEAHQLARIFSAIYLRHS